jgi:hypothetical protein
LAHPLLKEIRESMTAELFFIALSGDAGGVLLVRNVKRRQVRPFQISRIVLSLTPNIFANFDPIALVFESDVSLINLDFKISTT